MSPSDLSLLDQVRSENHELNRLLDEHEDYGRRLDALQAKRWRSPEDYSEEQRLKRLKLAGRDRIEQILRPLRASA